MAKLFKLPLISFIACALTIGGIFGAWTFSGGGSAGVDSNLTAGTTPNDYWQFNSVSFKFVCDNANNNPTLTGTFSDSSITKTISVHEDAGLTYEQYSGIGKPTCTTDGYMFSHWAYYKEGNLTHYNLDVGFNTNVTLYAQYVPTTNPAIYLYTSEGFVLQSYMFANPSKPNEYIANNFMVDENPGNRENGNIVGEGRDKYVVKKSGGVPSGTSDSDIVWIDDADSNDKVIKGLYNVFYSPVASVNPDWITFGSHCWFQRQYSLSLFGNPCKGWESELGINAPLGFVSETETEINDAPTEGNPYSDTKITTYKATKVVFTSEAWLGGNTDYQFKPGDRHFEDIRYPKDDISTYTNNYIEAQTSGSKNYELKDNEQRNNMFDITIEVMYKKYASNFDTAQYRNFVLCSAHIVEVVPYNYTVNYYATKDSEDPVDSESVAYGSNASNFLNDALNHNQEDTVGGPVRFVTTWVDKYTGQQFDINTLKEKEITQNLNLYPLYESLDPITINYKTYNGSWVTSQNAYVYNCDPNYTNYYTANVTPTASSYDGYTYKSKWQTELTLEGEQYDPSDIADFDYEFVNNLTGGTELNVFARYERMGTDTYLKVVDNDPINLTRLDDKIVFDNIGNSSDKYSFGEAKYLLGESSDILYGYTGEKTIGITGTTGFNLQNGNINVVNFSGKTVPTMKATPATSQIVYDAIYLKINSNWANSSARFATYFYDNGTVWYDMAQIGTSRTYVGAIPSGYPRVIFCRMNGSTTANNWDNRWNQTGNLTVPTNENNCYFIEISSWHPVEYEPNIIYLKPNSNWTKDGARFAARFYTSAGAERWVDMTDEDADGYYACEIPGGYPLVIFCRMNGSTTANNWDNRWNQTGDLTVPTNGNNTYTITDGSWNAGSWSTYNS